MTIKELASMATEIKSIYDARNKKSGVTWTQQDYMAGFVGDVGDLSKIVMAKSGKRTIDNVDEKLVHELCDCLWSVFVLADTYNIDLEKAFVSEMAQLKKRLSH